ncbi:hypothetical protein PENTCL1PPCAC_20408 [Pristionchus entomophagus]|uniref:RING-type domain-containing protein n=1 Tax=Pristionchus entomophagus TaxID=358040 RepID=A0AAV5TUS2_9BILA|nr:hypothetical protein PENTCL1PPCAC_20408 [Pristionchus entomophagus]
MAEWQLVNRKGVVEEKDEKDEQTELCKQCSKEVTVEDHCKLTISTCQHVFHESCFMKDNAKRYRKYRQSCDYDVCPACHADASRVTVHRPIPREDSWREPLVNLFCSGSDAAACVTPGLVLLALIMTWWLELWYIILGIRVED